eukprot:854015-Pyramimonas_sp.AAC.1
MWKRLEAQNDVAPDGLRDDLLGQARERQMSMARACADDIGSVVSALRDLLQLKAVFDCSEALACLKL